MAAPACVLAAEEMTVAREACDAERDACKADTSDWIVAEVDDGCCLGRFGVDIGLAVNVRHERLLVEKHVFESGGTKRHKRLLNGKVGFGLGLGVGGLHLLYLVHNICS